MLLDLHALLKKPDDTYTYKNMYNSFWVNKYDETQTVVLPSHKEVDPKKYLGWFNCFVPSRGIKCLMKPLFDYMLDDWIAFGMRDSESDKRMQSTQKACSNALYTFIYNAVFNIKNGKRGMFVSTAKSKWKSKTMINGKMTAASLSEPSFHKLLNFLDHNGYIIHVKGCMPTQYSMHYHSCWGRVLFTQKFYDKLYTMFPSFKNQHLKWLFDESRSLDKELVTNLWDKDTEGALSRKERRFLIKSYKLTSAYNKMMKNHKITLDNDEEKSLLDVSIERKFCRESIECGGRFYIANGGIQTMHKEQRKHLLFDGKRTIEMDIKGTHLAILYSIKGLNMMDDPYKIPLQNKYFVFNTDIKEDKKRMIMRKIIKKSVLIMINAPKRIKATWAINRYLADELAKEDSELSGLLSVNTASLMNAIKLYHSQISEFFMSDAGVHLQRIESDVMAGVIKYCTEKDIPMVQIYDSIICQKDKALELDWCLKQSWNNIFRNNNNLVITY